MHAGTLRELPIEQIERNPDQPRKRFDQVELQKLASSIEATGGVIQPVVVTTKGAGWQIVAGERRWRACQLAKMQTVLCRVIQELSERERAQFALLENLDRVELTALEIGHAYAKLESHHGMSQTEIAEWVGKDRTEVNRYIALTRLPEPVQKHIDQGKLSMGHAKVLLGARESERTALGSLCVKHGWSVRRLESEVKGERPASADQETDEAVRRMAAGCGERIGALCEMTSIGPESTMRIKAVGSKDVLVGTLQRLADEIEKSGSGEGRVTIELSGDNDLFEFLVE